MFKSHYLLSNNQNNLNEKFIFFQYVESFIKELKKELIGGRLYKIAQPENDELLLTIKQPTGQKRLLLSASASLPLIYLTESNKPSPMTAPNFCMLLRKHLQNGRIVNISQPGLERIVHIDIEHLDEMGDLLVSWDTGSSLKVVYGVDRCRKLQMTAKVHEQLVTIRDSGETNMFDIATVQRLAFERDFYELVLYLEDHRSEYAKFILTGEA